MSDDVSGSGGEVEDRFYRWLTSDGGPDDWHRFALGANWDFHGPEIFEWIASRPDCDKATALALFWRACPDFVTEYPNEPYEYRNLIESIRERWTAGGYRRSELAYDPRADGVLPNFERLRAALGERVDRELPASMRRPLRGRAVDASDDIEGMPSRFWPEELR